MNDDGTRLLVYCHAGCETGDVLAAMGLTFADLRLPSPEPGNGTLAEVESAYTTWMGGDDLVPLYAVLVTAASHRLDGDPLWLAVVGAPSSGKTEAVNCVGALPQVRPVSTLTGPSALLSGSARKDRAEGATGGLLHEIGTTGTVVVKDFTSVLSLRHEPRAEVLAALREVYDGTFVRAVGVDGGRSLSWRGKITAIIASTEALDAAHAVTSVMGERFVFVRCAVGAESQRRRETARRAIRASAEVKAKRTALSDAVVKLLGGTQLPRPPHPVTEAVRDALAALANLIASARSPVVRDYRGEPEQVPEAEMPARLAGQLAKAWQAAGAIGLNPGRSWALVRRLAFDSMPPLRRAVLDYLLTVAPPTATTSDVVTGVNRPRRTVWRALEDLEAHGVITRHGVDRDSIDNSASWSVAGWAREEAEAAEAVPEISPYLRSRSMEGTGGEFSGTEEVQVSPAAPARAPASPPPSPKPEPPLLRSMEIAELPAVPDGVTATAEEIAVWDFCGAATRYSCGNREWTARFAEVCPNCSTDESPQPTGETGSWTLHRFTDGEPVKSEQWTAPLLQWPEPPTVEPIALREDDEGGWNAWYICAICGHGWHSWWSNLVVSSA